MLSQKNHLCSTYRATASVLLFETYIICKYLCVEMNKVYSKIWKRSAKYNSLACNRVVYDVIFSHCSIDDFSIDIGGIMDERAIIAIRRHRYGIIYGDPEGR